MLYALVVWLAVVWLAIYIAHQPLPPQHHELERKDREIQHLTQQLAAVHSELQQTRQQQVEVTTVLQEDLQRQEEQYKESLRQLHQKLQEPQQMQGSLQEHENRQQDLNQQLQVVQTQLIKSYKNHNKFKLHFKNIKIDREVKRS